MNDLDDGKGGAGGGGLGVRGGSTLGGYGASEPRFDIHDAQAYDLLPVSKLKFRLRSQTAADLNEAENAIWDLNAHAGTVGLGALADAMLNIEALASVRMDGRQPSARDILVEQALCRLRKSDPTDCVARFERDRASLIYTLERAAEPCSVQTLCDIHERVLPRKHGKMGGRLRQGLTQVGGSRYHTFGTTYLMPPPENIEPLLQDLTAFLSQEDIMVVEQAGIAHAQLINIHPFDRGNGKMARAAVHFALFYRGIAPRYLLPITPVIVTSSHDYVSGISACAFEGATPQDAVAQSVNAWLSYFATCCLKAVNISAGFMGECERFIAEHEERLTVRRDSATRQLLRVLPALPVFSAQMAADYLGCSFKRASDACKALDELGIVVQLNQGKRNRVYASEEALDAYMRIDALR